MKNLVICILTILIWGSVTALSFSAEKDPFAKENKQKAYSEDGDYVGVIRKEVDKFVFYDKDTVSLLKKDEDSWAIYNREGKYVGKLGKVQTSFRLYDENDNYQGFVIQVNERNAKGRNNGPHVDFKNEFEYVTTIVTSLNVTPEGVRLYLYVMDIIQ